MEPDEDGLPKTHVIRRMSDGKFWTVDNPVEHRDEKLALTYQAKLRCEEYWTSDLFRASRYSPGNLDLEEGEELLDFMELLLTDPSYTCPG